MHRGRGSTARDLDRPAALRLLRETARDSGRVFVTQHASRRMRERGITLTQVLRCLRKGHIVEGPVRSLKGNWEMAVEVHTAGDVLTVVAALEIDKHGNCIVVVTTYLR